MARVVLAGASGFLGQRLWGHFSGRGDRVVRIGRSGPEVRWGDRVAIDAAVDGADVVINLAGRSVGCRYTDRNRNEILRSRVETTAELRESIARSERPPRVWLNASTATIYRHARDRPQTEATGELGEGFSVDVARNWEHELFVGELPGTRRVALRMAIVLGDGPALTMLLRAARFGLGGPQIDGWWLPHRRYRGIGPQPSGPEVWRGHGHNPAGTQRFSWIHVDDLVSAIDFLIAHDEIAGPVNLSAPHPSDNRSLMKALRQAVHRGIGLPAYRWMLEPGMFVLRQESELVLKSRWVLPGVLQQAGFDFGWPDLDAAIADLT